MKPTRVVSTKCTPGFACRAFSDTTLVCFIVNEHTTKCSHYKIMEQSYDIYIYSGHFIYKIRCYIDGLAQDCFNSSVLAME